jgi:CBS domain-containing protein
MYVGTLCPRGVITALQGETVRDACRRMREHHVGSLMVTDGHAPERMPIGVLTDRDIVVKVIALGLDPDEVTVGEIMTADPQFVGELDGVHEAIGIMFRAGVRRLPVVDDAGRLVGIIALDDLIGHIAGQLHAVATVVTRQRQHEARS